VNKNLKVLADRMEMKLPKDLGNHQPFIDGLKAKTDADFDRTYIAASVMSHQKCIGMFEKFSAATKNADLKAFANSTLPGLRTHLKNAEALLQTLDGPKATAAKETTADRTIHAVASALEPTPLCVFNASSPPHREHRSLDRK